MTQEEKNLLIRDLCGRLPYGVKIKEEYGDYINVNIHNAHIEHLIDRVASGLDKLVLRPMSSMTEEEINEYFDVKMQECKRVILAEVYRPEAVSIVFDWLNAHHFDYRDLIGKGLANEAIEDMYN